MYQYGITSPTAFEMTICVRHIRAEHNVVEECWNILRVSIMQPKLGTDSVFHLHKEWFPWTTAGAIKYKEPCIWSTKLSKFSDEEWMSLTW